MQMVKVQTYKMSENSQHNNSQYIFNHWFIVFPGYHCEDDSCNHNRAKRRHLCCHYG